MSKDPPFYHDLHPIRDGHEVYVMRNGERVKLSPLQASVIAQAWTTAVSGALVSSSSKEIDGHLAGP